MRGVAHPLLDAVLRVQMLHLVHGKSLICPLKNLLSHLLGRFLVPVFFKVGTFGESGSCKFLAAFPPGLEEERGSFFQMRVKPAPCSARCAEVKFK